VGFEGWIVLHSFNQFGGIIFPEGMGGTPAVGACLTSAMSFSLQGWNKTGYCEYYQMNGSALERAVPCPK
jgi:hypothetical protein